MPAKPKQTPRIDNVLFAFTDCDLRGSVVVREGEMVLDIVGGETPYLIVGSKKGHYYEGENSARGGNPVRAKWVEIDGDYVGIWHEGANSIFSFRL